MRRLIQKFDTSVITLTKRLSYPLARAALFIVFFWFGVLKLIDASPANPLVESLLHEILPFVSFSQFIIGFGLFEILLGVAFLIPGLERLAIMLLVPHMITTFLPLIFLPATTWRGYLLPTLEGQYIIKNLVIIALAFGFAAHLHPMRFRK